MRKQKWSLIRIPQILENIKSVHSHKVLFLNKEMFLSFPSYPPRSNLNGEIQSKISGYEHYRENDSHFLTLLF